MIWKILLIILGYGIIYEILRRFKNTLKVKVILSTMDIKATATYPLSLAFTDAKNDPVTAPTGTTIAWAVETTVGTSVGTITQDPNDSSKATLAGGDLNSQGVVQVTVTLTDGKVLKGQSATLTVVAGDLAAVSISVGTENPTA